MQTPPTTTQPNLHTKYTNGERLAEELGDQITELCSYIYAATYKLLVLIREFDNEGYWELPGLCSCAHWLNFKCGIGMNAAREKVRVAHALADLPKISKAFEKGQLSYSKARAMTRIANKDNEDYLLMIANHGTAHHVEKLVSKYSRAKRLQETQTANDQYANRELNYHYDENGSLVINAHLPPEQGALIIKALEMAMDQQFRDAHVSAETPEHEAIHTRRADALAEVAETYLNTPPTQSNTADRHQVIIHVTPDTVVGAGRLENSGNAFDSHNAQKNDRAICSPSDVSAVTRTTPPNPNYPHLNNGPHVSAETSRRIACDCTTLQITEDQNAQPLSIGRKSRSIPPSINRALRCRDNGCRFPGCTNTHFVDGHHIKHWADGGETSLENLVQLCRHHHRLVHEGGFTCERLLDGSIEFRSPIGRDLHKHRPIPTVPDGSDLMEWIQFDNPNTDIDGQTCVPMWRAGESIDWDLAVGHLFN